MKNKLLQKYIEGQTNESESEEVARWIIANDANRREYESLRIIYNLSLWSDIPNLERNIKLNFVQRIYTRFKKAAPAIAAAIITFIVVTVVLYSPDKSVLAAKSIHTPAGQRSEITLDDGTRVWLNANSQLAICSRKGNMRIVSLDGEAYFKVAKDTAHPFIVKTSKYDIKVTGTEFNISSYKNCNVWSASLVKGSVDILKHDGGKIMSLEPYTQAELRNSKLVKCDFSAKEEFLWRKGILKFKDIGLGELLHRLEIYYDVRIEICCEALPDTRYSGKFFMRDGLRHALDVLREREPFSYEYNSESNVIVIYHK